jgi:hypothetical protein
MNRDLGFSPSVYGLAAGLFSLGYAVGMVPSNVLLLRLGAPIWLATICLAWGATAGAFAFVSSARAFVFLRLLLGICEVRLLGGWDAAFWEEGGWHIDNGDTVLHEIQNATSVQPATGWRHPWCVGRCRPALSSKPHDAAPRGELGLGSCN